MNIAQKLNGKAQTLRYLEQMGVNVPSFIVVEPGIAPESSFELQAFIRQDRLFAVRSSAKGEDSRSHSFAGQFESFLNVASGEVNATVEKVRLSLNSERARFYLSGTGLSSTSMAVIVQEMVQASVSGVIFGIDPMGTNEIVISCVAGLGDDLMRGEVDGETIRISSKPVESALLSQSQIAQLLRVLSCIEADLGKGQDVEFAFDQQNRLFVLQARAITRATFTTFDASNIQESYPGKTSPLTFSFARRAYESVYLTFARFMGVRSEVIAAQGDLFNSMLGYHDSKIYYNLNSWYKLLSLLPFYRVNRKFMERMMGLSAPIDSDQVPGSFVDLLDSLRCGFSILHQAISLGRSVPQFMKRVDRILADCPEPSSLSLSELRSLYIELEGGLLELFGTPVVNDFIAMIAYGFLLKMASDEKAVHEFLCVDNDVISARPPAMIAAIHALISHDQKLLDAMSEGGGLALLSQHQEAYRLFQDYLDLFGDRSLGELKLEASSVRDDPSLLLKTIAATRTVRLAKKRESLKVSLPVSLCAQLVRKRLSDRENLRFYRTRVFGLVRRIFRAMGEKLAQAGRLDSAWQVFYLTVEEILGKEDFNRAEIIRRTRRFAEDPETSPLRLVFAGSRRLQEQPVSRVGSATSFPFDSKVICGTAASGGIVRGRARVIRRPQEESLNPGEILVAERTDPGWIMHFAMASAVVTTYGSVLSHSAIVARELGLPCVVAVKEAFTIENGDLIEVDGKAGTVKILERAYAACAS